MRNDLSIDSAVSSELQNRNAQSEMMIARQAQEVQVAMVAAKNFPRDELVAMDRIKASCQRPVLAEKAVYSYPRGKDESGRDKTVSGPSIRLAEEMARRWGNVDAGVIELSNGSGKSEMMAYAWDLETNTRITKTFSVAHTRDTRHGKKTLTDARDIYEATANFGARRLRACILAVLPGDVVEMALRECKKTLVSDDRLSTKAIADTLLVAFKEHGVTKEQLEKYIGKQLTSITREELVDLGGVHQAIRDGQAKVSDYFKDSTVDGELAGVMATAAQKKAIIAAYKAQS